MTKLSKAGSAGVKLTSSKNSTQKTRGDIGTAGVGLAAGYFGDLLLLHFFPHLGIQPGAASVYFSSAVVGIKQIVQSKLDSDRAGSLAEREKRKVEEEKRDRADAVLELLQSLRDSHANDSSATNLEDALKEFLSDQKLYKAKILTDAEWEQSLKAAVGVIKQYR